MTLKQNVNKKKINKLMKLKNKNKLKEILS